MLASYGSSLQVSLEHNTCLNLCIIVESVITLESPHSYEFSNSTFFNEWSGNKFTTYMVLIDSMLPVQGLCHAYVFKRFQSMSAINNINQLMSWPFLSLSTLFWDTIIHHLPASFHANYGGNIIALLWWVYSYWIQHIIWELDLETSKYLGSYMPQW